jgi:hypothetical protein
MISMIVFFVKPVRGLVSAGRDSGGSGQPGLSKQASSEVLKNPETLEQWRRRMLNALR